MYDTASLRPNPCFLKFALAGALVLLFYACQPHDHPHDDDDEHAHPHGDETEHDGGDGHAHPHGDEDEDTWAVTTWGVHFEIFAEAGPLAAGRTASSHTHVTALADFSAVTEGRVAAVLRGPSGRELIFGQDEAVRAGIFDILIEPEEPGELELLFLVEAGGIREEIPAGRVRVGTDHDPGGLLDPAEPSGGPPGGEEVPFLKEQQWRTEFATLRVEADELRDSVRGYAKVRPVAGGEILLTAPVQALVQEAAGRWPYPGLALGRGDAVFRLVSQIHDEHSLSELEADVRVHESELAVARANSDRLEQLHESGIVSRQQLEEGQAEVTELEARLAAAESDLATAQAVRRGAGSAETVTIRAPWNGHVASVAVTPGQAVGAGTALARLVKTDRLWIEVALRPAAAAWLTSDPAGLYLEVAGLERAYAFAAEEVRLVSRAPEIDDETGTVGVILEVPGRRAELPLGSVAEAEVVLPSVRSGLVIPSSALVDDGGVDVVYVQLDGETFVRREVTTVARQGERLLVEGLAEGERLVVRGGAAIRRATLMTGSEDHGHVH